MTRQTAELRVSEAITAEDLKAQLEEGAYSASLEPERLLQHTYLETFDWRVYQAGGFMDLIQDGDRRELIWRRNPTGDVMHRCPMGKAPGFIQDLPEGLFRNQLEPVLEMRTLLPFVRIESRLHTLRVLGDEDKTVVRLELEQASYESPDGEHKGELGLSIRLVPVRGYDEDFDRVSALLGQALEAVESTLFELALEAIGRVPGDYSSKLDYTLDPEARADVSTKEIHLGLLRTLEANVDGTRTNADSEYLHDLRVATRRTRSALTQIKEVFPTEVVERFKTGFGWIGQITGSTRDLDVYFLALDDLKASLPPLLRDDLEPLRGFLEEHHATEQKAMSRKLASPHFRKLLKEWRMFLEAPVPKNPTAVNAARPIQDVASERIWKMYRRVLKEGRAIGEDSPAEALHDLRKSCKKLRYLMEFFASLYPPKQIKAPIKVIKVLLDNLGNFQDLEVQAHALHHFAEQMVEEGRAGTDTLLSMGALIGGLGERQQIARDEFARIFGGFDTTEHRILFKGLFKPAEETAQ